MRQVAVIQARMGSTRLPGKTLMEVAGKPLLEHLIERLKKAKRIDEIVVATTTCSEDNAIEELCRRLQVGCFRGSSDDVLDRVSKALEHFGADLHIEIHGDGPLLDWRVIDRAVQIYESSAYDLVTNALSISYPPGLEVWVYKAQLAHEVEKIATEMDYRESPVLYLTQHANMYRLHNFVAPKDLTAPETYLEVDTDVDMGVIRAIFEALYPKNPAFVTEDVLAWLNAHPDLARQNQYVERRWKKFVS
jgi:spore coat polysaccharide biosynthesis protein SpsF